jgi:hypothetical protein
MTKAGLLIVILLYSCASVTTEPLEVVLTSPSTVIVDGIELEISQLNGVLEAKLCQQSERDIELVVPKENNDLISIQNLKKELVPFKSCIKSILYRRI